MKTKSAISIVALAFLVACEGSSPSAPSPIQTCAPPPATRLNIGQFLSGNEACSAFAGPDYVAVDNIFEADFFVKGCRRDPRSYASTNQQEALSGTCCETMQFGCLLNGDFRETYCGCRF